MGWLRQLGGWMVCGQEGVVLQGTWDGFANWVVGWSVGKKEWCCRVHGKGCPGQGAGCVPAGTPAPPYDCNAGFANWMGMERTKEGLVLPQRRQGLPTSSWRLRLKVL